ncbi:MAG: site-2 protease family protein [Candidatus Brocadiia bacterium]
MPFFRKEITLFHLFGLPIKANPSWLILVALVWTTLAMGWFPSEQALGPDRPAYIYWLLGGIGTLGLFASLVAHELCHSLVAREVGMPVGGITLFIFGGVSQLRDEPPTAGSEFLMAVVGPLSSVAIGGVFLVLLLIGLAAGWPDTVRSVLKYLSFVNFFLAAFNSVPAFPLDGGRVLRSIMWGVSGDLRSSTRVAAGVGSFFGVGLIVLAAEAWPVSARLADRQSSSSRLADGQDVAP